MSKKSEQLNPPDEFYKIINDFTSDILITFSEYSGIISKWWNRSSDNMEDRKKKETLLVFRHCVNRFPERFFDILYKNNDIFEEESDINTEFLPGIVFKQLWNLDISENTKETIWKYLQLILFSVIGTVHNSSELGDTAKLFEAINEEELKKKLEETFEGMQHLFNANESSFDKNDNVNENNNTNDNINMENIPNAEKIHEHINSMMGGKLGKLALELAEETAKDLNLDENNTGDAKDVFQKLFKNPSKMMNMVKNIGSKIDEKIKSGEIKESELIEEGMELLNKMKNMPGMEDMQKILSQMGMPGLGKGAKINMSAMESQLNRNMKNAKIKERMKAKAESISKEKEIKVFTCGEKPEKTPIELKPEQNKKTKQKGKK